MGNPAGGAGVVNVAVLMGGWSAEREVSLTSGRGIAAACRTLGHAVTEIDMAPNLAAQLLAAAPDVVFNALHGVPGEDGTVQGVMDLLGLAYTHSGLTASAIAIDKELTKKLLVPAGVPMPHGRLVASETLFEADPLPRPYVLKPVNEGSSVGVAIVTDESNYGNPIRHDVPGPWDEFPLLLAEPFIAGRELTVAVLGDDPLAVTELVPESGFYDYAAKYTAGLTRHICPAALPADVEAACLAHALSAHRLLGCRGTSRSDFRWDPARGLAGLFLLEVNTQPGMTPLSLVPEQARHRGISYEQLVQRLIDLAVAKGRQ